METFTWICQNLNMIFFRFIEILKFQRILISRSQGDRWGSKFGLQTFAAGGHQHYFLNRQGSTYHQFQKMILHVFFSNFNKKKGYQLSKSWKISVTSAKSVLIGPFYTLSKKIFWIFRLKGHFFQRFTSKGAPLELWTEPLLSGS